MIFTSSSGHITAIVSAFAGTPTFLPATPLVASTRGFFYKQTKTTGQLDKFWKKLVQEDKVTFLDINSFCKDLSGCNTLL